jgi:hypothetical protein
MLRRLWGRGGDRPPVATSKSSPPGARFSTATPATRHVLRHSLRVGGCVLCEAACSHLVITLLDDLGLPGWLFMLGSGVLLVVMSEFLYTEG